MFSRMLGAPLLLAAAVGVPYVATNGPSLDPLWNLGKASSESQATLGQSTGGGSAAKVAQAAGATRQHVITVPLQDALRMDVSKEWVYQRWDRKTTALSELGLYGVRVPLITGTQLHDVAGSLTYYFGSDGRVQRISFRGRTADTSQLLQLVTRRYGLQQQPAGIVGEQLFQVRQGEQVFSELRTRPEPVLRSHSPHESFLVNIELQRPDATTPLRADLPLLPEVANAPQNQAAVQPAAEQVLAAEESGKAGQKVKGKDRVKVFFPRSRVPAGQIESLERRDRFW